VQIPGSPILPLELGGCELLAFEFVLDVLGVLVHWRLVLLFEGHVYWALSELFEALDIGAACSRE
jgi:hypothetical protein